MITILTDWEKNLLAVQDFIKQNGRRPQSNKDSGLEGRLGTWIINQAYRIRHGNLSKKQTEAITVVLGIGWENILDRNKEISKSFQKINKQWELLFEELNNFIKTNKRLPKPAKDNSRERALYQWILNHAIRKRKGTLLDDKEKSLTAILGEDWWKAKTKKTKERIPWSTNYNYLVEFVRIAGHRPDTGDRESHEHKLAKWLMIQAGLFRRGKLPNVKAEAITVVLGIGWADKRNFKIKKWRPIPIKAKTPPRVTRVWVKHLNDLKRFIELNNSTFAHKSSSKFIQTI